MRDLINLVDKIINEAPEELRQAIQQRVEKIPDEGDLVDILKYTKKYTLKKDVEKFTTLRNYKDLVSGVFLKSLADADLPDSEIKKFLKKLSTDGILDEKKLLSPGQVHVTNDIIDNAYEKIFNLIKMPVYADISGKIGEMGDVGKGEYLLDILSPSVNRRGAPGDLDVNGTKIELKAGENGRIGPAGSQSLAGRFQREFVPVIKKLVPNKPIPDPTVFNPKKNMSGFSEFFESAKNVKVALSYMLGMHYPDGIDVKGIVNRVVDSSGNINGEKLKKEMLKASFTVYKNAKTFDGILIMDKDISKFLYIGSPEDIEKASDKLLVSYPSWTDQQGNAMKVTLAKGGRSGASSVSAPADTSQQSKSVDLPASPSRRPAQLKAAPSVNTGGEQELGRKRRR